jgi:hypothetical protein
MFTGCWLLAIGCWLLATCYCRLATCYLLLSFLCMGSSTVSVTVAVPLWYTVVVVLVRLATLLHTRSGWQLVSLYRVSQLVSSQLCEVAHHARREPQHDRYGHSSHSLESPTPIPSPTPTPTHADSVLKLSQEKIQAESPAINRWLVVHLWSYLDKDEQCYTKCWKFIWVCKNTWSCCVGKIRCCV